MRFHEYQQLWLLVVAVRLKLCRPIAHAHGNRSYRTPGRISCRLLMQTGAGGTTP